MDAVHSARQGDPIPWGGDVEKFALHRDLEVLPPDHPDRQSLQAFIAAAYRRIYGARVEHFARQLVGLRNSAGGWSAGLGYTLARPDALFVEHYLDRPVEHEIASRLGIAIGRNQVVEVGNLAACGPGAARRLIVGMTALLHRLGHTWVVFTSTRALLNSFARLEIEPILLAPADPGRLPDRGRSWGSYYDSHPQVMAASIPIGFAHLASKFRLA